MGPVFSCGLFTRHSAIHPFPFPMGTGSSAVCDPSQTAVCIGQHGQCLGLFGQHFSASRQLDILGFPPTILGFRPSLNLIYHYSILQYYHRYYYLLFLYYYSRYSNTSVTLPAYYISTINLLVRARVSINTFILKE